MTTKAEKEKVVNPTKISPSQKTKLKSLPILSPGHRPTVSSNPPPKPEPPSSPVPPVHQYRVDITPVTTQPSVPYGNTPSANYNGGSTNSNPPLTLSSKPPTTRPPPVPFKVVQHPNQTNFLQQTNPPPTTRPPEKVKALIFGGESISEGRWLKDSAGGCINHPSFRKNPQFLLAIKSKAEIRVFLKLTQDQPEEALHHIGFYVAKSEQGSRILSLSSKDLVDKTKFQNTKDSNEISKKFPTVLQIL